MSYVKYCDSCGQVMSGEKKITFNGYKGHPLVLNISVQSEVGMGEFHICRPCAMSKIQGDPE